MRETEKLQSNSSTTCVNKNETSSKQKYHFAHYEVTKLCKFMICGHLVIKVKTKRA